MSIARQPVAGGPKPWNWKRASEVRIFAARLFSPTGNLKSHDPVDRLPTPVFRFL